MTFTSLLSELSSFNPDVPLVFEVDDQTIGTGYHVTELRHSLSTGIDCGGNIETWQEARLQLLDGAGEVHMSVGKFRDIVKGSLRKLPELSQAPLLVEFSPDNLGLQLMTLGAPMLQGDRVTLELQNSRAVCKPAQRSQTIGAARTDACCGETSTVSACCA